MKKVVMAAITSIVIALQVTVPALAATDQQAFDAAQAGVEYLSQNQAIDGSITGFGGETEWSVIAVSAAGRDSAAFQQENGASAAQFLQTNQLPDTASATDVERRLLAVAAAGEGEATFDNSSLTAKLQAVYNNGQIGDPVLLNDDIFGVIAIDAIKDDDLKAIAQDALDYFLAHQQIDGGFSYTTDTCAYCGTDSNDTAAAIIAMHSAEKLGLTHASLESAKNKATVYLLSTQQSDGGFGYDVFSPSDGSSTAWSLMALNVIGDSVASQAMSARDWLLTNQNADGGFSYGAFGFNDSSTSITAHAIVALLGSSWLLDPVPLSFATTAPTVPASSTSSSHTTVNQQPAQNTSTAPIVQAASATPRVEAATAQQPVQDESSDQPAGETKAAQTDTPKPTPKKEQDESTSNYVLYGIPVLAFTAIGWYVIQSRKQEG